MHALLALADAEGGDRKASHLELEYAHSADATSIKVKREKKRIQPQNKPGDHLHNDESNCSDSLRTLVTRCTPSTRTCILLWQDQTVN